MPVNVRHRSTFSTNGEENHYETAAIFIPPVFIPRIFIPPVIIRRSTDVNRLLRLGAAGRSAGQ